MFWQLTEACLPHEPAEQTELGVWTIGGFSWKLYLRERMPAVNQEITPDLVEWLVADPEVGIVVYKMFCQQGLKTWRILNIQTCISQIAFHPCCTISLCYCPPSHHQFWTWTYLISFLEMNILLCRERCETIPGFPIAVTTCMLQIFFERLSKKCVNVCRNKIS